MYCIPLLTVYNLQSYILYLLIKEKSLEKKYHLTFLFILFDEKVNSCLCKMCYHPNCPDLFLSCTKPLLYHSFTLTSISLHRKTEKIVFFRGFIRRTRTVDPKKRWLLLLLRTYTWTNKVELVEYFLVFGAPCGQVLHRGYLAASLLKRLLSIFEVGLNEVLFTSKYIHNRRILVRSPATA